MLTHLKKLNLEVFLYVFLTGIAIGYFVFKKLHKPELPQVIVKEVEVEKKVNKRTVKKPDGTEIIDEVVYVQGRTRDIVKVNPIPNYRVGGGIDNVALGARLGQLPLWLESGYNWKSNTIEVRLSYEF